MGTQVTVRELLQLQSLRNFKLLAGKKGLDNPVASANILDFEYAEGARLARGEIFTKKALVVTSFLFAQHAPEKILPAVENLVQVGVSALAYKPVVFEALPEAVLAYADKVGLPVFSFADEVYFENIIYEVMARVTLDEGLLSMERSLERMLLQNPDGAELADIAKGMFRGPAANCAAVCLWGTGGYTLSFSSVVNNYNKSAVDKDRAALGRWRDRIFALITLDSEDIHKYEAVLADLLHACRISSGKVRLAFGGVHPLPGGLAECAREAWTTATVCELEGKSPMHFRDIGTYQYLVPMQDNPELLAFMRRTLAPIEENEELLRTAIAFVQANGDMAETAVRLYCHKNTVRYRVNKLRELLGIDEGGLLFDALATAVKLYLLKNG
ncbi:PucR family transcriptional regulator [Ruminococcaceae bacterium OttesenSCG-928-D13]|nr:PucR family transcriptional regulator [Ruminococcaceae bacterium OttesenSCG-928-D13]